MGIGEEKTENPEYEQRAEEIKSRYDKKNTGIFHKALVGVATGIFVGCSFFAVGNHKLADLKQTTPMYREWEANQNYLVYLRGKLKECKPADFPEQLSAGAKRNLESLKTTSPLDSIKISRLEKEIEITEKDSVRITETNETRAYNQEFRDIEHFFGNGVQSSFGISFLLMLLGMGGTFRNIRKQTKELRALAEQYGIKEEK